MTAQSLAHRRTWLFGPGADGAAHASMTRSGASVLIQDLEDFTPPQLRAQARQLSAALFASWRDAGALACVRINALEDEGIVDLQSVMPARPDVVAYPKAGTREQIRALDAEISRHEKAAGIEAGTTQILPVCETALGVVNVRELAAASPRVRYALLGAEDLATDLFAERTREAFELEYARARFLLECRAAGIEPVDAPYTFDDAEGAAQEARRSRRLGYRTKSLVRADHVQAVHDALVPTRQECDQARRVIEAFEAGRARGEERVLVDGLWIEVPTYLNARRLLQDA
jgi:citrate lyase subunit beta / citryl-CoA lyase